MKNQILSNSVNIVISYIFEQYITYMNYKQKPMSLYKREALLSIIKLSTYFILSKDIGDFKNSEKCYRNFQLTLFFTNGRSTFP